MNATASLVLISIACGHILAAPIYMTVKFAWRGWR